MKCFVGFSKSGTIFGRIIEWGQKGRFSHAFFAFEIHGKWYVTDSTGAGIKVHLLQEFAKHKRMVKKYEIQDATYNEGRKILDMCVQRSYDKYPVLEIVGNACQILVKWMTLGSLRIKNPFELGERSPRCQEWVAIILRDVFGYRYEPGLNLDDTDLLWLDDYLQKATVK
jgi:hypothetical protein